MFGRLRSAIRRSGEQARNRRGHRELLRLDDHYLRDIGLTREDVRAALAGRNLD